MSATDDLVNAWVKKKFLESPIYKNNSLRYGPAGQITVLSADVQSYCGCYSEFTRDDGVEMQAILTSKAGNFGFTFGLWGNLPQFIEELSAYQNLQYEDSVCPYDDEDY
jgi:hypothetical protein